MLADQERCSTFARLMQVILRHGMVTCASKHVTPQFPAHVLASVLGWIWLSCVLPGDSALIPLPGVSFHSERHESRTSCYSSYGLYDKLQLHSRVVGTSIAHSCNSNPKRNIFHSRSLQDVLLNFESCVMNAAYVASRRADSASYSRRREDAHAG